MQRHDTCMTQHNTILLHASTPIPNGHVCLSFRVADIVIRPWAGVQQCDGSRLQTPEPCIRPARHLLGERSRQTATMVERNMLVLAKAP